MSKPRVAGATWAGELYRRRTLQPLHAGKARSEIATGRLARLVAGVVAVLVDALAEDGTICSNSTVMLCYVTIRA